MKLQRFLIEQILLPGALFAGSFAGKLRPDLRYFESFSALRLCQMICQYFNSETKQVTDAKFLASFVFVLDVRFFSGDPSTTSL